MSTITERFQNIYQLNNHYFEMIGVGSIGSYTTYCLAQAGAKNFMLWDDDVVDTVNIGVQHYNLQEVGLSKVKSMKKQIQNLNPNANVGTFTKKYDNATLRKPVQWLQHRPFYRSDPQSALKFNKKCFIICGIDNMSGRKGIMESLFTQSSCYSVYDTWIIDARMGSETLQMYTWQLYTLEEKAQIISILANITSRIQTWSQREEIRKSVHPIYLAAGERFLKNYLTTWYSDEEGSSEPCNARSTNYCGSMAGAFINNAVRKICDEKSLPNTNLVFNFPSMMLQCDTDYSRLT